ncbi:RNase A-like domain-containing protein [Candidatus Dependentiae bacterium]
MFKSLKFFFVIIFTIIFHSTCLCNNYNTITFHTQQKPRDTFKIKSNENNPYSIKDYRIEKGIQELSNYLFYDLLHVKTMSKNDIKDYFSSWNTIDLFEQYHLYACSNYLDYIRNFPEYEKFILEFHNKMHKRGSTKNKNEAYKLRKSLRNTPGFNGETGFADFIEQEANRIKREMAQRSNDKARLDKIKQEAEYRTLFLNDKIIKNITEESSIFDIAITSNDKDFVKRQYNRSSALKQTRAQNYKQFDYSNQVKNYKFTDSNAEFFDYCYGTMLDKQLHEELCKIRTAAINFQSQYIENQQIQTLSKTILHFTALAKVQSSPDVAFHLSNFSHYLLKAEEILVDGIKIGLTNIQNQILHPIDKIIKPLCFAGMALGQAIFEVTSMAVDDPLSLEDPSDMIQKAVDLSCSFVNYVKENPKESVAALVEFFVPVGIAKFAKFSKLKKFSTLSKSFEELAQTSKSFQSTANVINKVINPIKIVLKETGEVLKFGLEHGKDALRNVIKVIKVEPELVSVGDISALQFSTEHFKDFEKLSEVVRNYNTTIKNLIYKIRNVGNDILDVMEKAGGHTLQRHVSKTNNKLLSRLAKEPNLKFASTFTSKKMAINSVKENLIHNAKNIALWIKSESSAPKTFDFLHKHSIGKSIAKNKKNPICGLTKSRIVLKKNFMCELGFKIITAFPIVG